MKGYVRADRVGTKILTTITTLLRKKINDPRLESVTVTGVKVSKDLREAYIYFTIFGSKKAQNDAKKGFISAQGFIKRALASELGLKFMPKLEFHHDDSLNYGAHINTVLKNLEKTHPAPESDEDQDQDQNQKEDDTDDNETDRP